MISHIHLLRSIPTQFIHREKWRISDSPIMLLTGLSGSGKTYAGKIISEEKNTTLISLDALKFYEAANLSSRQAVDEFVKIYPEITHLISIHWAQDDNANTNDTKYTDYSLKFFDFVYSSAIRTRTMLIIEGIQIFVRIPWERAINIPLGIIGTSGVVSFFNFYKRDYVMEHNHQQLGSMWQEFRLHHSLRRKRLNQFIDFINEQSSGIEAVRKFV